MPLLLRALEAMALAKLSVLHWHLTDAASVPLALGPLAPAPHRPDQASGTETALIQ